MVRRFTQNIAATSTIVTRGIRIVECFRDGKATKQILVEVAENKEGKFYGSWLREAIKKKTTFAGSPTEVIVHVRNDDASNGKEIGFEDELDNDVCSFNYRLPSKRGAQTTNEEPSNFRAKYEVRQLANHARAGLREDLETWPHLDDPATTLEFKPDECIKFVTQGSNAGRWCLESDLTTRMVRKHYGIVWERLQQLQATGRHMLLKGNAGVGKSLLLDLLLSWSLFTRPNTPVILITVLGLDIFCKVGGAPKRFVLDLPSLDIRRQLIDNGILAEGQQLLVLHDILTADSLPFKSAIVKELHDFFKITCVVASTLLEYDYSRFIKDFSPTTLVLPPLSHDEAKVLVQQREGAEFDEATFDDWFDKVGGVPRHLRDAEAVKNAVWDRRCVALTVEFDPVYMAMSEESSKYVAMRPSDDALNLDSCRHFDFISQSAWREWRWLREAKAAPDILRRLRETRDDRTRRDAYGPYFKKWFLHLLEERGGVLCRQHVVGKILHCVKRWELPDDSPSLLKITRFWGKSGSTVIKPADDPTLYIPLDSDFPLVDAVVAWKTAGGKNHASLVRVTVADSHNPKSAAARELLSTLGQNGFDEWDFTWVVDPQSKLASSQDVDGAVVDDWLKVPQNICRIDNLMCWVCEEGDTPTISVSFPLKANTDEVILGEVKARVNPDATAVTNFESIYFLSCSVDNPFMYSTK